MKRMIIKNFLSETELLYYFGKTIGTISFSIQGCPGQRQFVTTKWNKIIFVCNLFLYLLFLTVYLFFLLNLEYQRDLMNITSYIIWPTHILSIPLILSLSYRKRKIIFDTLVLIENIYSYALSLNLDFNLSLLQITIKYFLFTHILLIISFTVCEIIIMDQYIVSLYFLLNSFLVISIQSYAIIFLITLNRILKSHNHLLIKENFGNSCESSTNIVLKHFFFFFNEVYNISKNVNRIFNIIFIWLFNGYLMLVQYVYYLQLCLKTGKWTLIDIIDIVTWNSYFFLSLLHTISLSVTLKNEVRYSSFIIYNYTFTY